MYQLKSNRDKATKMLITSLVLQIVWNSLPASINSTVLYNKCRCLLLQAIVNDIDWEIITLSMKRKHVTQKTCLKKSRFHPHASKFQFYSSKSAVSGRTTTLSMCTVIVQGDALLKWLSPTIPAPHSQSPLHYTHTARLHVWVLHATDSSFCQPLKYHKTR